MALVAAGTLGVIALAAVGIAALKDDRDDLSTTGAKPTASDTATTAPGQAVSADEQCTDEIKANERWVCLTSAKFKGETLTIRYRSNFAGAEPNVRSGYHLHIYGGDGVTPPAEIEGRQAMNPGVWYVEDQNPSVRTASSKNYTKAIGDAPKVCARIATSAHILVPDKNGTYVTGNCVPIDRSGLSAAARGTGKAAGSAGQPTASATQTPTDAPTETPTQTPTPAWTPSDLVSTP